MTDTHAPIPLVELHADGTTGPPRCLTCGAFLRRGGTRYGWQHAQRTSGWDPRHGKPYWPTAGTLDAVARSRRR